ncbi:RtcB family protein [Candidatus Dependentiae bacterium]|nr:RtcB family protein [Candidatus Dependentiae bacterium]
MNKPTIKREDLIELNSSLYEIPRSYRADMRVPARVFTNEALLGEVLNDSSLTQLVNVATLPGIQNAALAMPDIHQGYGFPIGGVAGFAIHHGGIISPGGIGYDINCGVRLLSISLSATEIKPYLKRLAQDLFHAVPSGVGRAGSTTLNQKDLDHVLKHGAHALLEQGYGVHEDIENCEENGRMKEADPKLVSTRAKERGHDQLGTLGAGNHFLEVQEVTDIYDEAVAQTFGLHKGMVTVMIHCGSRGLGHQNCTDYVKVMLSKSASWPFTLPDRELACAPFFSQEGQDYYASMCASANFAWANRHMIGHRVRECLTKAIGPSVHVRTIYDLSHNMGKRETHLINGKEEELIVHRKGATRAFPAGRPEVPVLYRATGHPVLIPGTMGTSSYVCVGTQEGMELAWGSSCHGAGRRMSRMRAKKTVQGATLREQLEAQGIIIQCSSNRELAEEAPQAYKDVDNVVRVVQEAHLARPVARLKPLAVIKG